MFMYIVHITVHVLARVHIACCRFVDVCSHWSYSESSVSGAAGRSCQWLVLRIVWLCIPGLPVRNKGQRYCTIVKLPSDTTMKMVYFTIFMPIAHFVQ
jgi:putative component of membrane protein insertase Oxa1/YidC/SpoIIIJ protein YidD